LNLKKIKAVVHGTYHSETVCINCTNKNHSVNYLLDKGITVIISPCKKGVYDSTVDAIENGVIPVYGMTDEMLYVKTLIGLYLGNLKEFLNLNINNEYYEEE
ncbi:MAG: hypothetical protein IJM94_01715, partial [Clostridia bacterium]|nr:hypothetical protein [Clostridia bacterium]